MENENTSFQNITMNISNQGVDTGRDTVVVMTEPQTPVQVMKYIMSTRNKIATFIHLVMNVLCYIFLLQYLIVSFFQSSISQIVWLSLFSFLVILDFIFHIWQLSIAHKLAVVDTNVKIEGLRVAMIVTKAPSEPWNVVKNTLESMLSQDIDGYPYDVWLADENPSDDTKTWCISNGVRISCRKDVEGYNNVDWPRRRRCKEGNLIYFYEQWGYEEYDVVFQFDSDHAPTPSYLKNSLPAFMDPKVDYVAMPNINNKGSWISNARRTQEAWYYGPSQMSYSYDYMPMMTGSHYAVRTSALKEIGGIGPELDEDMTTTIMMASYGKKGVYAGNAIAYGEGPLCLEDAQKQELQWAKSAVIAFFRWRHVLAPKGNKLTCGSIFRFVMIRTWYTLQIAFFMYLWLVIAPLVFVGKWCTEERCTLSFTNLVIHSTPLLFANWGYETLARRNDWLRPAKTPFFSFDLVVYRILRPIWNTIGIFAGISEMLFNVVPCFSVTRKGESSVSPLGILKLWYLLLIMMYYAGFIGYDLVTGDVVPIMLAAMYVSISIVYLYVVLRHFVDQKFKANSVWNYVGHSAIIASIIGSIVTICVMFGDQIFVTTNAEVFIPKFYGFDMWLTIGMNALSLAWMLILFVM